MHNGGWFHPLQEGYPIYEPRPKPQSEIKENLDSLYAYWIARSRIRVDQLAQRLKLEVAALDDVGTAYAESFQAYAFPMRLPSGRLVGIRLRNDAGKKWAVRGSKAGLFIPFDAGKRLPWSPLFVCEGPTDTAAALSLGFFAIGRPACLGQEEMVRELLKTLHPREVIICYDNDKPGIQGADKLIRILRRPVIRFVPPAKDLRQFVTLGGTRELVLSILGGELTL
jgi:DNA primase